MPLDTKKVWKALQTDPAFFTTVPEGQPRTIFEQITENLPTVFGDTLDQQISIDSLLRAKLAFLRHMSSNGLMTRLVKSYPTELLIHSGMPVELLCELANEALQLLLSQFEEMIEDVPEMLKSTGLTEAQALAHPKMGKLSTAAMQEFHEGTLTLGRLLELCPYAVLSNT